MGERQWEGTPHLRWVLTTEPYKPNVEASRVFRSTVSITVSSGGLASRMELTPAEAREFAATVIELADMAEKEKN